MTNQTLEQKANEDWKLLVPIYGIGQLIKNQDGDTIHNEVDALKHLGSAFYQTGSTIAVIMGLYILAEKLF